MDDIGSALGDYTYLLAGVLFLIAIKIFLVFFSYERKKNWYTPPLVLAKSFFENKTNKIVVTELLDINKLDGLIHRNLAFVHKEWQDIDKNENQKNDASVLIEKLRNIAILLSLIPLQHAKDKNSKEVVKNKYKFVKGTITRHSHQLKDIREKIGDKKWLAKVDHKTVTNFIDDIREIIEENTK